MTTDPEPSLPQVAPDGWTEAKPSGLVRPTWLPAAMAFGITLLFWGIIASTVVLVAGGLVIAVSFVGWIGEMRHDP